MGQTKRTLLAVGRVDAAHDSSERGGIGCRPETGGPDNLEKRQWRYEMLLCGADQRIASFALGCGSKAKPVGHSIPKLTLR